MDDMKAELEVQKKQNLLLSRRLDAMRSSALNNSRSNVDNSSKYKEVMKKYLAKIKELESENRALKESLPYGRDPNGNTQLLRKELEKLREEKEELERNAKAHQGDSFSMNQGLMPQRIKTLEGIKEKQEQRIRDLEKELKEREEETEIMRQQQNRLIGANQRMEKTINELQEQLKNLESINQSETHENLLNYK